MAKNKASQLQQKHVDLRAIFGTLQNALLADLKLSKTAIKHPGTQGGVTESRWRKMFEQHLPARYCATDAFVVDSSGAISDQMDLVIYDRHYSPFILNEGEARYVTAESVYGVFEIKPTLNASTLAYAAKKIASVRTLNRTSVSIPHAGGMYAPKALTYILGGVLCVTSAWKGDLKTQLTTRFDALNTDQRLDLGCVLAGQSFDVLYGTVHGTDVTLAHQDTSLVFFMLRLLERLQALGTIAAIDLRKYSHNL